MITTHSCPGDQCFPTSVSVIVVLACVELQQLFVPKLHTTSIEDLTPATSHTYSLPSNNTTLITATMADILTFSRRAATTALRQAYSIPKPVAARPFSIAARRQKDEPNLRTDKYPDSQHATRKDDRLDVQSDNSAKGRE